MGHYGASLEGAVVAREEIARAFGAGEGVTPGVALARGGLVRVTGERVAPEDGAHDGGDGLDAGGHELGVLGGQAAGSRPFVYELAGGGAPALDARLARKTAGAFGAGGGKGIGVGKQLKASQGSRRRGR